MKIIVFLEKEPINYLAHINLPYFSHLSQRRLKRWDSIWWRSGIKNMKHYWRASISLVEKTVRFSYLWKIDPISWFLLYFLYLFEHKYSGFLSILLYLEYFIVKTLFHESLNLDCREKDHNIGRFSSQPLK